MAAATYIESYVIVFLSYIEDEETNIKVCNT